MLRSRHQLSVIGTLQAAVLMWLGSTAVAQEFNSSRYWISEADIVKELGSVGLSVDASQIHLSVRMSAAVSPKLEVVATEPLSDNQVRIELRCADGAECLPFFATLNVKDAILVSAAIRSKAGAEAHLNKSTSHSGVEPGREPGTALSPAPEYPAKLKVGSQAVMEIREGRMDIHLQVLAIDTGVVGQQVRVCTLDRKRVFHATVTGEETVIGVVE